MQDHKGWQSLSLFAIVNGMEFEFFGQRLKAIRKGEFIRHESMGLRELARQSGIAANTLSQWESGLRWRDKIPPADDVQRLADALGIDFDVLTGQSDKPAPAPIPEIQRVPLAELLQRIGATPYRGRPIEDIAASAASKGGRIPQGFDEARPLKRRKGDPADHYQDIIIENECMVDLLYPGDIVTIDTRQEAQPNDVVVAVRFNDELLVKNLRVKDEHQYLQSEDGTTIIPIDQYIRILGPVVSVQRSIWRLRR